MPESEASQLHIRSSARLRLRTFGTALVERDGRPVDGPAQQRRVLALLALLAAAGDGGITRDRVLALLWPERESDRARQALAQTLYHARRSLGEDDLFLTTPTLRLNPSVVSADVGEFQSWLEAGELAQAVALYHGNFLDGFHVTGASEFEQWASGERARLSHLCAKALGQLATSAAANGQLADAVAWRRRCAALDPFNSRAALDLIAAMAEAGDRAGALRHAQIHEMLLRTEFDVGLEPAVAEFVEHLRAEPVRTIGDVSPANGSAPASVRADGDDGSTPADDVWSSRASGRASERPTSADGELAPRAQPAAERSTGIATVPARWRRGWQRTALVVGGTLAVTASVLVATMTRNRSPSRTASAAVPSDMIVVAPFRVSGADPVLAYLHEGMVDLLVTKLTEDDATDAADAGAVMSEWRRMPLSDPNDVPSQDALKVAAKLGASRAILGSVVGTPARMVLSASLLDVRSGQLRAQATIAGSSDSLTVLVDRLATRLLADEAGIAERLASHTTTSLAALRPYLLGQAAYRRGNYRAAIDQYRAALQRDASFAMAGLGLAQAAHRVGADEVFARGLSAAWSVRSELTDPDRLYLEALAGPHYPARSSKREMLAGWEQAVVEAPNRPGVWLELGERLFHDGRLLGMRDWASRAAAALRQANELAPSLAAPTQYLLQLAAERGDTAEVRELAAAYARMDSTGDLGTFVRWRSALALGDHSDLAAIRKAVPATATVSLRQLALATDFDFLPPADADAAHASLRARAVRRADRAEALLGRHAFEMNSGHPGRARDALAELEDVQSQSARALRLRVVSALFGSGDVAAAAAAVQRLVLDPRPGPESAANACVAGQWWAWHGQWTEAEGASSVLSAAHAGRATPSGLACAALIDATLQARQSRPDAARQLDRAEALLVTDADVDELLAYGYLAIARLRAVLGDTRNALATARRRPHMEGWSPFLTTQAIEEGNLALAVGDTTGALDLFRRVMRRRPTPEDGVEPSRAALQSLIERLSAAPSN